MGIIDQTITLCRPFLFGCALGIALTSSVLFTLGWLVPTALADSAIVRPNGDGSTNQGVATTCGGATRSSCLDDNVTVPSVPLTSGDYITWSRNQVGFFQMATIPKVSSVSQIQVPVYHIEGGTNMQLDVSLWDATETTQYGTTQNLAITTSAAWGTATFSSLSLTQAQLDGLRVRLRCTRPSGGSSTDCRAFAAYANVTYIPQVDVTVGTTGTQRNLDRGTTTAHVGGAFSIKENISSRDITEITITATGTVDAANSVDNIALYYEMDTTGADNYNCSDQTYDGTETQYGTTDTDGFSAANGTSTFTSAGVTITTTSSMCVYVVLDVLSGAGIGNQLEIEIANPSVDVGASGSPTVRPTTTVAIAGATTLLGQNVRQIHYHWRNDDNTGETDSTSATGGFEDATFNQFPRSMVERLRFAVENQGNQSSEAIAYRLEVAPMLTSCEAIDSGSWVDVGSAGGDWSMATTSLLTEGADTTNILVGIGGVSDGEGSFVGTAGQKESSSQTSPLSLASNDFYEPEFAVIADSGVSEGSTHCFRLTNAGVALDGYDVYPQAVMASDVQVSATGSQATTLSIPTAGANNGGGFVITDASAGAHTVSSITITASGTVDLVNDIDNIKLWYETDTVTPFDCTGESFDGDETQFGVTDTDGFSVNGTSTFTHATSVSPTQGVCLYMEYDVLSGATDDETIELRIDNPATDITINAGSISPNSLVDIPGVTYLTQAAVTQAHYHWRNNQNDETSADSLTSQNEDTSYLKLDQNAIARLRVALTNDGGEAAPAGQYRLEWAQKVSTCEAIQNGWVRVDATNDAFTMASSQLVDNADTTDIPVLTGGVSNDGLNFMSTNGGQKELTDQTDSVSIAANSVLELEYSIQATATSTRGATYCFRITDAGTEIDNYVLFPEVQVKEATDFAVTQGVSTILNGNTTASITEGADYDLQLADASRAFVRITNVFNTGAGPATIGNNNAADVTAYISNPGNITSGITFTRSGSTGDTRIAWEIIEYVGSTSGENEIVIRGTGVATYGAANTSVTTGTVSGVVEDADVVPWITGQGNPDTGRFDYNTGLSISAWNAGSDTATFTRGESGTDAVNVSYAIVEFVGANWKIASSTHTYTSAGVLEGESITAVNSLTRTFLHTQKLVGANLDTHADLGHQVYLSGIGTLQFLLDGNASTPSGHTSRAWIIENLQNVGDTMKVWRSSGSVGSSASSPVTANPSIGTTLSDQSIASIFVNGSANTTNRTFHEPFFSARLLISSSTAYELWVGDPSEAISYRTEVVEWPTAINTLYQNDYRLYVDNDAITPTDPWPAGAADLPENGEMTSNDDPIISGGSIRLRVALLAASAALPEGVDSFALQYAERPEATTCSAVTEAGWKRLGETGSTTALWRATAGTPADGTTLPSTLLSDSDTSGTYEEENNTVAVPNTTDAGQAIEYDWNIENHQAADKTDYCFRMTYADGTLLKGYNFYPVVRTIGFEPVLWDWKWYNDENSLTPTTSLAATNTAPTDIANQNVFKLRAVVSEVSGGTGTNVKFKLQYSEYADFSAEVYDVVATGSCVENSIWCYADGAGIDNAIIDQTVFANADACSGGVGDGCGTHNETAASSSATFDQPPLSNSEYEFTLKNSGARANAVYYFRLFDVQNQELVAASSSSPSLVVEGPQLTFTTEGVSAGATIEGVTADVTTTPTAIPFGSIPMDTEYEAVYRMNVDTSATEGFQLFMYQRQPLTNTDGEVIAGIAGTNASPVGWSTGCPASADGCFGYHAGDDTLAGGSSRFAPNDSYAALSTEPEEVMHSAIPSDNTAEIVFKLQIRPEQPAGDYQTEIVYLVVPSY